ncbi:MAG: GAF domain-containing protein, partial [Chloroflexota bacterium]
AQISGSIRKTKDLFEHMVEGLSPTLNVDILGLLLYDDTRKVLEGQVPFLGMPIQFVELYRAQIEPGSQAEKIWESQKIIQTEKASTDPDLTAYNLAHLAQAAGIRSTLLIPLISNGRSLGYLQAGNKRDGTEFNPDDVKLMSVLASQAAPIIENALLIQASRLRTQRSEAMRRIASLVSSTASLDEVLKYSISELARMLRAESAFILLLDEDNGEMFIHKETLYGLTEAELETIPLFSTATPDYQFAATFSQDSILSGTIATDRQLPQVYKRLFKQMSSYQSAAIVPLLVREHGVGEIVFLSAAPESFNRDDVFSIFTATGQLASAVERAGLYTQTDEGLQRRVDQLSSLNRISRELNTTLDIYNLMQRTFGELKRVTNADGGSIILFEENGSLTPVTNDSYWGERTLKELSPLEKQVAESGTPIIETDFSSSEHLSSWNGAQSAMIAPIIDQELTVGIFQLFANKIDGFDSSSVSTTQALSSQAAIAIRNARRHRAQVMRNDMLQRRVESLSKLFENNPLASADSSLEDALESIAENVQNATSFDKVLLYVFDEDIQALRIMSTAGLSENVLEDSKAETLFWDELEGLLSPDFLLAEAYFIPSERVSASAPMLKINDGSAPEETLIADEDIWQPEDMFIYPLYGNDKTPMGLISVFEPISGLRPNDSTAQELAFVAQEAKLVITGFKNTLSLRNQVGGIQDRASQASNMNSAAQDQLSILLHKDLEQTIAIQQLNERGRRIRTGLDIAEIANQQPDRSAVLMALGNQLITKMGLDTVLIAEPSSGGPRLIHSIGAIPKEANPEALLGQRNPLHHSITTGQSVLVSDLDNDPDWQDTPLLKNIAAKGFISLPISSNGHVDAAILATSHTPL